MAMEGKKITMLVSHESQKKAITELIEKDLGFWPLLLSVKTLE